MSDLLNRIDLRFDFVTGQLAKHTITPAGCWEYKGVLSKDGYGKFKIYVGQFEPKKRSFRAHRVSYAYHNGEDPGALSVCHSCDNPACINPDHLFLGTAQANTQDMHSKGRGAPQGGENNPGHKVGEDTVRSIVELIRAGLSNMQIADGLPVTHSQVSHIRLGKSWRALTESMGYDPDEYRRFTRRAA